MIKGERGRKIKKGANNLRQIDFQSHTDFHFIDSINLSNLAKIWSMIQLKKLKV